LLDYFVGIPATIIDPDDSRRYSKKYGNPSNYRLNIRTLEYRTPGAYHLSSPQLTRNLLCLTYAVTEDMLVKAAGISNGWTNMSEITRYETFQELYGIPDREKLIGLFYSPIYRLKEEGKRVASILAGLESKYENYFITHPVPNQEDSSIIHNWRSDEETHRLFVQQERGSTTT